MSKAELLEWAKEPTPRLMGGPLQDGYRKGVERVKEMVRASLAYGGGGMAGLKKSLLSLLDKKSASTLYETGIVDGTRDAAKSAARRMPELQDTVDRALRPKAKAKPKTPVRNSENMGTRKSSVSQYTENLVIELYRDGWMQRDIAKRIGRSPQTVLYTLKKNGIELRPRHGKRQ